MKAKKLPSGSWRVQVYAGMEDGKRQYVSFTADTKAEAEYQATHFRKDLKKNTAKKRSDMTVSEAIDAYLELSELLSPTTIAGYNKIKRTAFVDLMDVPVKKLDSNMMQAAINRECRRRSERTGKPLSAKTVKNNYGLIASALKTICGTTYAVKLPTVQHKNKELPTPEEIIRTVKGTEIELPCLLAMWLSFSMSEIRGIKCSAVKNGYITIDKVVVDVDNVPIVKATAKTDTRIRRQACPGYIMELIKNQDTFKEYKKTGEDRLLIDMPGYIIKNRYKALMKKAGMDITFHDLRHVFASVMLNVLNIPEKIVQEEGGWKTPHIMKSVYSNTFTDSRKQADKLRDEFFVQNLNATRTCNTEAENR